jgi:hypothetical protein
MASKMQYKAPRHVKASSPEELTRAMVRNNILNGIEYNYFSIGQQGSSWFAWYLADVTDLIRVRITDQDG